MRSEGTSYYLQLGTTQAAVLMLCFNNEFGEADEWFDLESLQERTNLQPDVLRRVLHSFLKTKIVRKRGGGGGGKGIKPTDEFSVNSTFTSPKRRINIPMPALDDSSSGSGKRVDEDRSISIEACVVRIMKSRKTMGHQQLIAEVLSQLAFFKPHPKAIKRRIEALIDREYIERSQEDNNIYNYLA